MAFSKIIFDKESKKTIDEEDSFRKLNAKNSSLNKSAFPFNKENNDKKEEFELEIFNEKSNELKTVIKLQKKEIQKFNKLFNESKFEKINRQEQTNIINEAEFSNKVNKSSNYFKNMKDFQINDSKKSKILENQFLGDSDVSFSSKIENNDISKKWFSEDNNLNIVFDDLEIKLRKIDYLKNSKINFMQLKDFKFINVEICNLSDSSLLINNLQLDSTESKNNIF